MTVKLAAGRIGARGPVRVLVSNANAFAVTGTLAGTARIGAKRGGGLKLTAKRFTVAATGRTTIKLALSKALRRELQRKRKLVLRLSAAVSHAPATASRATSTARRRFTASAGRSASWRAR